MSRRSARELIQVPETADAPGSAVRSQVWADARTWDAFVRGASDGSIMHLWAWKDVIERSCGHRAPFLAAVEGNELRGVLPLVVIRSRLLGRRVVSLPFLDHAGMCTSGDRGAETVLLQAAKDLADDERAVLELRQFGERDLDLARSLEKVTMQIDIGDGAEALWKRIPSNRRGQVRKAQRNGLTASTHGVEAVPEFYRVLSTNMRDLGSPEHGVTFFRLLMDALGEQARIILVRTSAGETIGAGIMLRDRDRVSLPWSSSLRSSFRLGPNQILYWEAMCHAIAWGASVFDFGRSSRDSGTFESKREWGTEPVQLAWYHYPESAAASYQDVQRFAWVSKVWQRLPVPVANAIGPRIRKSIPN